MKEVNNNDLFKEVLTFLAYFDSAIIEKIPSQILSKMRDFAADSKAEFYIDENKDLNNQKMSEDCKNIIALLYYNYVASENEKKEISKSWDENEKQYQKFLQSKYDFDKIIQNKKD